MKLKKTKRNGKEIKKREEIMVMMKERKVWEEMMERKKEKE